MDPLTHTLTGLMLSRAGLKRLSAYAVPILLLAVNVSDIDVGTLISGQATYLHYHRYITHAFLAAPLLALLPVVAVRLFARKPFDWKWAYALSLLGVATHPLLDWMNAYGVRFLWPFSEKWYRLDIVSLGDVWISAALVLALIVPMLARLVSSEIGARPGSGRGLAIAALCFMLLYPFGRYLLHQRALEALNSRLYEGLDPTRVAALPDAFNPLRWRGLVETVQFYSVFDVSLMAEFDPTAGRMLYKPEPGPREAAAAIAARKTPAFRSFLEFSQYPYWRFLPADQPPEAIRVEAMDLRFGEPLRPRFVATAIVDRDGRVAESRFRFEPE